MRNKIMMVVFFLCAQSFFSQITITDGATLYVDGKSIVSTSKDTEKEYNSATVLVGKIKVAGEDRFDSDQNVSLRKIKKSPLKELAKVSAKKKTSADKIKIKKTERLVFVPYPKKNNFSSSSPDKVISVLPGTQNELRLAVFAVKDKTNILIFSERKQTVFLNERLLFYNHFHSSLSVRPPPFA